MHSNHLILCQPLLFLPSIFPIIRVFCTKLALFIRWAMYQGFSFRISSSKNYLCFIYFRIDWCDPFLPKGLSRVFSNETRFKSINSSVLSLLYDPTLNIHTCLVMCGKTIDLTTWPFVSKVMCLLFKYTV